MDTIQPYHIPALLRETVDLLVTAPSGVYIDATMGGAGHSRAILERLSPAGRLFGFDQDADAASNAPHDPRFTFVRSNFRYITNFMRFHGIDKVDGILADIGVSFHHFDDSSRGFSFRDDSPLDMRMNTSGGQTAAALLAEASEERIVELLTAYTDLRRRQALARAIVKAREEEPILTTGQLEKAVASLLSPKNFKKELAQIFQMLRIAVNDEIGALEALLQGAAKLLKPGGRLAVLSYHSIEDRAVKNFMKSGSTTSEEIRRDPVTGMAPTPWKAVTRTPLSPSEEEIERNPRSRSAKLRVAERTKTPWPPKE